MDRCILPLYFFIYALLVSSILLAFFLYLRYRHKGYLHVGILLISMLTMLLAYFIPELQKPAHKVFTSRVLHYTFAVAGGGLFIFIAPITAHSMLSLKRPNYVFFLSSILLLSFGVVVIIEMWLQIPGLWKVRELFFLIGACYAVIIFLINVKKIKVKELKLGITFLLVEGFFVPPAAVLYSIYYKPNLEPSSPANILPQIISTIILLFFGLFCTAKYFFCPSAGSHDAIPRQFITNNGITKREVDIIQMTMHGYRNARIANELFISVKTVKNHLYHIYHKVGVGNRMELVAKITGNDIL